MKREHDHFLKTERWLTPFEVKQVKGKLPTSRELGRTQPVNWSQTNQPTLSRSFGEVADAWDGKKPGTRPANESSALHGYIYRAEQHKDNIGLTPEAREKYQQEQRQLDQLYGIDRREKAFTLGATEGFDDYYTGLLHMPYESMNALENKTGIKNPFPEPKKYQPDPTIHPEEIKELHSVFYSAGRKIPDLAALGTVALLARVSPKAATILALSLAGIKYPNSDEDSTSEELLQDRAGNIIKDGLEKYIKYKIFPPSSK